MKVKKNQKIVNKGRVYIHASFNNTIITVTDSIGGVISWSTAGESGFKGTKKSTPFAAQTALKRALDKAAPYQLNSVEVFVSGVGNGRDAALRGLSSSGLEVTFIKDVTPIPHNGTRQKKPRRV